MLWHRHPKVMQRWSADSGVLQPSGDHTPSALASTHDDHSTTQHTKTWDGLERRPGFQFLRPSPHTIPHQHINKNQGREGGRLSAMTQGTCLPNRPQALSSPQSLGSLSAIPSHVESPNQGDQAYRWGPLEVKNLSTPRVGHPIFRVRI